MSSPRARIESFSPSSGPVTGGTQVTILGQNFLTGCRIKFGNVDAVQVSLVSDKKITAFTPPGPIIGPVSVRIINPDQTGDVALDFFEYTPAPRPTISSVQPASGPLSGGTQVTINGQNFVSGCQVKFEGVAAQIISATSVQLKVLTPPAQFAGPVTVRVTNPDQQVGVAPNAFTYGAPPPPPVGMPPTIFSIDTLSGPVAGGTQVTIDGQNFAPNCQVKFENNLAQVLSNSATRLVVLTPPAAGASLATVRVINPNQPPAVAPNPFQYVAAPPPPPPSGLSITSVNPPSGQLAGNTEVTIQGQGFAPGCIVRFGDKLAQLLTFSSAQLRVNSPAVSAPGRVNVSVVNPNQQTATAANAFQYVEDASTLLTVKVLAPNGREMVQTGTTFNIQWSSTGASQHRVEYSLNGGLSFFPIVAGLAGTVQSYVWSVPPNIVPTGQTQVSALIRVAAQNSLGQEATDSSDESFTITVMPPGGGGVTEDDEPEGGRIIDTQTIVAGQTADFMRFPKIKDSNGRKISRCVKRELFPTAESVNFRSEIILFKQSVCAPFIETCAVGQDDGCGKCVIRIITPITAPHGTYRFDVIGTCLNCDPPRPSEFIRPPITIIIEQPRLALSVTPDTPGMFSLDAGRNAIFSIDADRTSYLGEIQLQVRSVGPLVLEERSLILPPKVMQTDRANSTERRLPIKIKTFAPEPRQDQGTPPGTYILEVFAKDPPHPDVIVTPVRVTVNVAIVPDVGIIFDRNRMEVNPGAEVVYEVILFRYNPQRLRTVETTAIVQVVVNGQLVDLMTTITQLAAPFDIPPGTRTKLALKFTVPVETTPREYEIRIETKFNTDTDPTLQTRTDTAKLIVGRPELILSLKQKQDAVRAGERADFKVGVERRFFDEDVVFSLITPDGLPENSFQVNGRPLPYTVPKGQTEFDLAIIPPVDTPPRDYRFFFQGLARNTIIATLIIEKLQITAGRRSVALLKDARDIDPILMGLDEELTIFIGVRRQSFDDRITFSTVEDIPGSVKPLPLEHKFEPNPLDNPAVTTVKLIVKTKFAASQQVGVYRFKVIAQAQGIQIAPLLYEIRVIADPLVILSTGIPVRTVSLGDLVKFRILVRRLNYISPLELKVLNQSTDLPSGSVVDLPEDMKDKPEDRESWTTLAIQLSSQIPELTQKQVFPFKVGNPRIPPNILQPLDLRLEFPPPPSRRPPIIRGPR